MTSHPPVPTDQQSLPRIGRPRRLTTARVVDAGIELADQHGLVELSMPKLARHLGVGTMTLYSYVESKQNLLDKMASQIFEDLQVGEFDSWEEGLFSFFSDFRTAALAHPTLAGLLAGGRVAIPEVFDILETFLTKMTASGIPAREVMRIFYTALTYTIGFVLWEIPRAHLQAEDDYAIQWAGLIAQLDPASHPILTGPAAAEAPTVASAQQFDWGLKRIIGS